MSDFVIQFGDRVPAQRVESILRDRPGLTERPIDTFTFAWGSVIVQRLVNPGCAPLYRKEELICCAGRPCLVGEESDLAQSDSVMRTVAGRWRERGAASVWQSLSGMYVMARCNASSVEIITDQMGFRPAYVGNDRDGGIVSIGTFVEGMAEICAGQDDYDTTSLAELLVYQQISYPYTSRRGIEELEPASVSKIDCKDPPFELRSRVIWRPAESSGEASSDDLAGELKVAMREAAKDLTAGLQTPACTLSGGWDSRAMLAVLRECCDVEAITFQTRPNREIKTARMVAAAAGCPHHIVQRDSEYYVDLMERSVDLLGIELRANAHGLCLIDAGQTSRFDAIIGGQLCDTFLKDHFFTLEARSRSGQSSSMENLIRTGVRAEMVDRREAWKHKIRQFRPTTADEWQCFWPASRQNDAGHNLGNSRLYASDSLFMHRKIVTYSASFPVTRYSRTTVTKRAFLDLFDDLAAIPLATTGQAPTLAEPRRVAESLRRRWRRLLRRLLLRKRSPSMDWNDVQHSWVNWEILQQAAPGWRVLRQRVMTEAPMEVLRSVLRQRPESILGTYQPALGAMGNLIVMQIAQQLRRTHTDQAFERCTQL